MLVNVFFLRLRATSFNENEVVFNRLNSGILQLNLAPDEVGNDFYHANFIDNLSFRNIPY